MVVMASIAESVMETQVGFGVITLEILVVDAGRCLATSLLVMSVSVMIPARPPSLLTTREAAPR
eukprot:CAMPEP_0116096646 /NCGR_PEP_ID=MMETSP0327-20121206/10287_1 /TAXON_ID=44447 /ORGANISM="Pseudo-nitzschia delicatissima, Strain B596" /LENGTH=63 /DNA_ID=CAMNT_0003588353 /DNA_START=37 /DNA_END=225 /DNA_ORIENTATION=-